MTRVCAKFIPKFVSAEQKKLRLEIAQDNLEMVNNDDTVLKKVITGDESWVYGYGPETKQQFFRFFSIMKVLCTTNMHRQVRQSIKNISFKFWNVCVKQWEENACTFNISI